MEEPRDENLEIEPIIQNVEQPDLGALREAYQGPSRWAIRWVRLERLLKDQTLWTALLAVTIVAVLVVGYLAIT